MRELGFVLTLKFGNDALGQHFAQLHAPLVEGIYIPNRALSKDRVLIERDEFAQSFRR